MTSVISAVKVAAGMDITEKRRPQDGAFSAESAKGPASFRVASVGAFGGEKITIRVLASSAGPLTLRDAGLIDDEKRGKYIYYSLNTSVMEDIYAWVAGLLGGNGDETEPPV